MIENFLNSLPEFFSDAIIDTLKLIPFLFIIFVLIEMFENFFAEKIPNIVSFSKKLGPVLGACLALIPQCGFSVIMTTLFIKRYITIGTLIAVYIATSDEAIPILLANPSKFSTVIHIIVIKFLLAVIVGYITDLLIKTKLHECEEYQPCSHLRSFEPEKGCCNHEFSKSKIKNVLFHPLKHTCVISVLILVVCICLNYLFKNTNEEIFSSLLLDNNIFQIAFFAIFGLIPNCAISVLITMMYIKNAIMFGSVIAGLTTNAGLGLLILFTKKENWRDFLIITGILIASGIIAGSISLLLS